MQTRTAVIGGTIGLVAALGLAGWWSLSAHDPAAGPAAAQAREAAFTPFDRAASSPEGEPKGRYEFVPGSGVLPGAEEEPRFPPFEAAEPESELASATSRRITDNVLNMFDHVFSPEYTAKVRVACTADGRRCQFEAPARADMGTRLLLARQQGRWGDHLLEGVEFEGTQHVLIDGERWFRMVAKAP